MMAAVADIGTIITAIVTPFDERLEVDEEAFVATMRHLAANGSDGVVVCGTTGEAPTLVTEETLRLFELAAAERPEGMAVIAGTGSNDTRHAVHLTEAATERGVDAVLSVTPYYNKPSRAGLKRHFEEVARATDKPVVLYNIPSRTALDMPNDLLAELAQIDRVDYVKQANHDNLAKIDGLRIFAGNDDMLADVLDLDEAGGILVASHVVGPEMRRMVDEPENRRAIHDSLRDVFAAMFCTASPAPVKAALAMIDVPVGGVRLPLVEVDEEQAQIVRGALERHGLLQTTRA
jgi:4-hydroxy-tetrahydrodipicolinate synthase